MLFEILGIGIILLFFLIVGWIAEELGKRTNKLGRNAMTAASLLFGLAPTVGAVMQRLNREEDVRTRPRVQRVIPPDTYTCPFDWSQLAYSRNRDRLVCPRCGVSRAV